LHGDIPDNGYYGFKAVYNDAREGLSMFLPKLCFVAFSPYPLEKYLQ